MQGLLRVPPLVQQQQQRLLPLLLVLMAAVSCCYATTIPSSPFEVRFSGGPAHMPTIQCKSSINQSHTTPLPPINPTTPHQPHRHL